MDLLPDAWTIENKSIYQDTDPLIECEWAGSQKQTDSEVKPDEHKEPSPTD